MKSKRPWLAHGAVLAAVVAAIAAVTAFAATAAPTARHATVKPSNTSAPTISGNATEGGTLTANNGNWDGTAPITFAYQWQRCDENGGSCSAISGATQQTYALKAADRGSTLRVKVTATNSAGSTAQTTVPTAVVTATPVTGCPSAASGATVAATDVNTPARLQIDQFQSNPGVIPGNFNSFSIKVHVMDTCGQTVSGASVYATAVPFNQVNVPSEQQTGSDGWATLTFNRQRGFPATTRQQLMVMFLRARKPGENPLAGITGSRLVSFKVDLHSAT